MIDLITLGLFCIGFIFLIKGAHILVDGASVLAKRYGVSTFMIGLTVVAFGTSIPELTVNIIAGIQGNTDIILGNILGSNIANIFLILGIISIFVPVFVGRKITRKELPISLLAILILFFIANDFLISGGISEIDRIDGLILIGFFSIFIYYIFSIARKGKKRKEIEETADVVLHREKKIKSIIFIIVGLIGVSIGGNWIVDGAIEIASIFGVSETLIGLTIISIGTSIPELATSLVALRKKLINLAVGNVIGSNIFNIFLVLGVSSLITPIQFNLTRNFEIGIVIFSTLILFIFLFLNGKIMGKKYEIKRWQGFVLLFLYIIFILTSIFRG